MRYGIVNSKRLQRGEGQRRMRHRNEIWDCKFKMFTKRGGTEKNETQE